MRTPLDTTRQLGHIATRNQLVARGYSGFQLTHAVRVGQLRRVRRGWYATRDASREQLIAVRVGGRLSHLSAARSYGLWSGFDSRVHIGLVRGASRLRSPRLPEFEPFDADSEVILHWTGTDHVDVSSACVWRVPLEVCLREVVAYADRETAVACLDTAMTLFRLTSGDLERIFRAEPLSSRLLAKRARRGSDSGPESIARQRFQKLGIRVRQQVKFPGIRRVDMSLGRRVIVEIDGREFHDTSAAFGKDRKGDAELIAKDYVVLRFSFAQVIFDWPFVERTVLAALRAHG